MNPTPSHTKLPMVAHTALTLSADGHKPNGSMKVSWVGRGAALTQTTDAINLTRVVPTSRGTRSRRCTAPALTPSPLNRPLRIRGQPEGLWATLWATRRSRKLKCHSRRYLGGHFDSHPLRHSSFDLIFISIVGVSLVCVVMVDKGLFGCLDALLIRAVRQRFVFCVL